MLSLADMERGRSLVQRRREAKAAEDELMRLAEEEREHLKQTRYKNRLGIAFDLDAGRCDSVKDLAAKGALDINGHVMENTMLYDAALKSHEELCSTLIVECKADVNAVSTKTNQTPLHAACEVGNAELSSFLLGRKAIVDHLSTDHVTPLALAMQHGHVDVVRILLQHGADVSYGFERIAEIPVSQVSNYGLFTTSLQLQKVHTLLQQHQILTANDIDMDDRETKVGQARFVSNMQLYCLLEVLTVLKKRAASQEMVLPGRRARTPTLNDVSSDEEDSDDEELFQYVFRKHYQAAYDSKANLPLHLLGLHVMRVPYLVAFNIMAFVGEPAFTREIMVSWLFQVLPVFVSSSLRDETTGGMLQHRLVASDDRKEDIEPVLPSDEAFDLHADEDEHDDYMYEDSVEERGSIRTLDDFEKAWDAHQLSLHMTESDVATNDERIEAKERELEEARASGYQSFENYVDRGADELRRLLMDKLHVNRPKSRPDPASILFARRVLYAWE